MNHPFWGTPVSRNPHMGTQHSIHKCIAAAHVVFFQPISDALVAHWQDNGQHQRADQAGVGAFIHQILLASSLHPAKDI